MNWNTFDPIPFIGHQDVAAGDYHESTDDVLLGVEHPKSLDHGTSDPSGICGGLAVDWEVAHLWGSQS